MLSSLEQKTGFTALAQTARRLTLLSYWGLQALLVVSTLWLFPPPESARAWVIVLVQLFPLWLFLPGVLSGNPRTHAWLCFVSLFYLTQGILAAFVPGKFWLGLVEALLSSLLFVAAMLFTRWRARQLQAQRA